MLVPLDHALLESNPLFAQLYQSLTGLLINDDGTSKDEPSQSHRQRVREELHAYRVSHAKQQILTAALSLTVPTPSTTTASSASDAPLRVPMLSKLPGAGNKCYKAGGAMSRGTSSATAAADDATFSELASCFLLLPQLLQLREQPSASALEKQVNDDLELLLATAPWAHLPQRLPQMAPLLSTTLRSTATQLTRILSPQTNRSYTNRVAPRSLPAIAAAQVATAHTLRSTVYASRERQTRETLALVALYTEVITVLCRSLEAKHTLVSRHLELDARAVALDARRAQSLADSTLLRVRHVAYPEDVTAAMTHYAAHLSNEQARVEGALRALEAELRAYGVTTDEKRELHGLAAPHGCEGARLGVETSDKSREMWEIAKEYRDMGEKLKAVCKDLDRLKTGMV